MPGSHNRAVRIDDGVDGTRLSDLSPERARLTTCDLIKGFIVKRHHFAAHVVVLMATVLEQAVKNVRFTPRCCARVTACTVSGRVSFAYPACPCDKAL